MFSFVHLSRVAKVTVVKRIRENEFCLVFFQRSTSAITPTLRRSRMYAMLEKKAADIFQPRAVLSV
ncbi:MAG TPA: hypothetical protein VJK53_01505 [Candidatus Paceibacterota bacterium]